jgi:DNA-binding SARP family transcriptional activator
VLFRVLGPVEVDSTDAVNYIGARKPRSLLALLLLRANAWVSVAELVDVVWPGQTPPASAERNIGTYIWQLRRTLPPFGEQQRIESRSGAYRIRVESGELDADRFEALLAAGTAALEAGDPAAAADRLQAARSLWRGTPYEGLVSDLHQAEVTRLGELHWAVREQLADALIGAARLPDAIALCTSLTAEDPLRESVWARLLVALRAAGRKADALAAYQRARTTLVNELGIEPGRELRALQQSLLADPPEPPKPPDPPDPPDPPKQPAEVSTIVSCLANHDVRNAWLLTSTLHEYVESGGHVNNWPRLVERVAAATGEVRDWYGEMIVRNILGIAYARAGRIVEARAEFTAAIGLAAEHDDRDAESTIQINLADLGETTGSGRTVAGCIAARPQLES